MYQRAIVLILWSTAVFAALAGCARKTIIVVVVPTATPTVEGPAATASPAAISSAAQAEAASTSVPPTQTAAPATLTTAPSPTNAPEIQPTATVQAPPTTSAAAPAAGDASALVNGALKAMQSTAYRANISQSGSEAIVEFTPPDRYYISSAGAEYIIIGKEDVYLKSNGKWTKADKQSAGIAGLLMLVVDSGIGYGDKITEAQVVGTETLDGIQTTVVSYQAQMKISGASEPYTNPTATKMWIGADGLPHKVEFQPNGQERGTTTIKYDPSIQVTAPAVQ